MFSLFRILNNSNSLISKRLVKTGMAAGLALFAASAVQADNLHTLDWVPLGQLTPEQRANLPLGSCGAYISPIKAGIKGFDQNSPLETSSESSEIKQTEGFQQVSLIGDVIVKKGYDTLTADQALYSEKTGTLTLEGNISVRQPDLLVLADKGSVNQTQNSMVVDGATFVIHSAHIRGQGKQLSQKDRIIRIDSSEYTFCEPGNNDWSLKGSKIVINTETRQGSATNVRLTIKGIPVFYWPYLRFPIGDERLSGFLFPSLESSDGSVNVSIPYYFNLAPNYDLILTPHFLQNHGTLFEANVRHLNHHFSSEMTLTHLSNDKGLFSDSEQELLNSGTKTAAEINPFTGHDRWLVGVKQEGGQGKKWSTLIDYNAVSDYDYINDLDSSTLNTSNSVTLKQQIKFAYDFDHWDLTINNQQFQTLTPSLRRPYKQLPQVTLDGEYNFANLDINIDNEWVRFDHSDAGKPGNTTLVGNRFRLKQAASLNNDWDAGYLRNTIQVKHLGYQLDTQTLAPGANTSPSVSVPQAIIDGGLLFDRFADNYQQTFEPRLYYFYSQYKDQSNLTSTGKNINFDTSGRAFGYTQLFKDTRFSGGDRIDDANQLSIGLTTRFIGNESGRELFTANIGKALYFDERRVTLNGVRDTSNNSPIATALSANINEQWKLTNDAIYDDDIKEFTSNTFSAKYRNKTGSFLNIDHRYSRNSSKQITTSLIQPLANHQWNFIVHINHDYINKRQLEQLLGVEYNSCCYAARLIYKKFLDDDQIGIAQSPNYDEGIILEFQFYGLGGTGKQINKLLNDSINGYEKWQSTYNNL